MACETWCLAQKKKNNTNKTTNFPVTYIISVINLRVSILDFVYFTATSRNFFFFPYPYWSYPASPCYDRTSRRHSRAAIGSLFPLWSAWLNRLRLNHSCHLSNHRTRSVYQMTNSNAGSAWRRPITEEKAGFVRNTGVRRGQACWGFFLPLPPPPVGLSYPVRELHEVLVGHSESRGGLKPAGGRGGVPPPHCLGHVDISTKFK